MKVFYFDGTQPCAVSDPEAWFPNGGNYDYMNVLAKNLCGTCKYKSECLELALTITPAPQGIWGGMTERDRALLKRRMSRQRSEAA
jgi:hypothetical protein